MTQPDLSIWSLVAHAEYFVQFIMLVLLSASLFSWTIIIKRVMDVKAIRTSYRTFEQQFWSGEQMANLFRDLDQVKDSLRGMSLIFYSGFKEFLRLQRRDGMTPKAVIEGVERSMQVIVMREADDLEQGLSWLSSIASVSPYIGLLGTVWGIMHSFRSLGGVEQATLAMVAPGIAEALIATAMGLLVAIPAAVAYNRLCAVTEGLTNELANFRDEFAIILHREVFTHFKEPA